MLTLASVLGPVACEGQTADSEASLFATSAYTNITYRRPGGLCAASLQLVDSHLEFLAEGLQVDLSDPVDIILANDASTIGCKNGTSGCYEPENDVIRAQWESVLHELVHAMVWRRGPSLQHWNNDLLFWNEGLANAYEGDRVSGGPFSGMLDIIESHPISPADYAEAGHFVRWIIEEFGFSPFRALIDGESFVDAYGRSVESVVADYEANAPFSYDGVRGCYGPLLRPDGGDGYHLETEFSCDEPGVVNDRFESGRSRYAKIELAEPGRYELRVFDKDRPRPASLAYCYLGTVEEKPPGDWRTVGDLPSNLGDPGNKYFNEAGRSETTELELREGTYMLAIPVARDPVTFSMVPVD